MDTGALYARYRQSDDFHLQSVYGWRQVALDRIPCVTTDLVIAESITLMGREFGSRTAAERARAIYGSTLISIIRPNREDELHAIDLVEKYADQSIHFVDCVSFVIMRRHKLKEVFGFDRHFETAGFRLWPRKHRS